MTNFKIEFTYPLLLLLIVLAVGLALLTFFRSGKRYRRNRNRITSLVLHIVVMVLAISVLAGINVTYDVYNAENEVMLVVDVSDSSIGAKTKRDTFVQSVIRESADRVKVGVVTFGYTQEYAVPLTNNTDTAYQRYLDADLPDTSASDILSALNFARDKFNYPETAKIVLVSDGLQTDTHALTAIKAIATEGIKVDTSYFETEVSSDAQIIDVKMPDYNVIAGEPFKLEVTLNSSLSSDATIVLNDEHSSGNTQTTATVTLKGEVQTVEMEHVFTLPGLHKLTFTLQNNEDTQSANNVYCTFVNLDKFEDILLVERNNGEASMLATLLQEDYNPTVVNIFSPEFPSSLEDLREYDQVVLVNIANADMPQDFAYTLREYVQDLGGGLLTVGGNKYDSAGNVVVDGYGDAVPNAYNKNDMLNSVYQDMLPVKADNYSPPVAVMLIIDRSGSMGNDFGGQSKIELAKKGALSCIQVLTSRDYVGVMTLEENYSEDAEISPVPQRAKIENAIHSIQVGGGTVFKGALERAGAALLSLSNVERRHIILVTDGAPADAMGGIDGYGAEIARLKSLNITLSVVTVGAEDEDAAIMRTCAEELGGGRYYNVLDHETFTDTMRDELLVKEIKAYNAQKFTPSVKTMTSVLNGVADKDIPQLGGFYGSILKDGATEVLSAPYVPVYAQWKYGKGTVGSFMSDLNGVWSADWLSTDVGKKLITNIINGIFPMEDVAGSEIDVEIEQNNYTNQMSVYTKLNEGETVEVQISGPKDASGNEFKQTLVPTAESGYSKLTFQLTLPGVYTIRVQKLDAFGNKIGKPYTCYTSFSYSDEYNTFADKAEGQHLMQRLAELSGGKVVENAGQVFENMNLFLHKELDPKPTMLIIALVLFLLDIAVRKFKFKWLHEIIRDIKLKRSLNKK